MLNFSAEKILYQVFNRFCQETVEKSLVKDKQFKEIENQTVENITKVV